MYNRKKIIGKNLNQGKKINGYNKIYKEKLWKKYSTKK